MAQEYYGYAERQDDSLVNWSEIGKNLTDTLKQEQVRREKQKAEIDAATNKSLSELAAAPRGTAEDGNKFVVDYSNDASQAILLANRLLKSGKMPVKDYTLLMANINSGTTQLFNLQKEYQKYFEIKKQRMNSNDPANKSQRLEVDSQGQMEAFGDFGQSRAIIDPLTGRVNVGIIKKNDDGTVELTDKVMAVQDMFKSLGQKYNYFPSAATAETISSKLAPIVMTQIKAGSISEKGQNITYTDPLQREALREGAIKDSKTQKALDEAIKSFLNIPINSLSILTDDIGIYYNVFTEEDRKKDPEHAVLNTVDKYGTFEPKLTDNQKKAAFDYMKLQAESMIGQKVEKELFSPQAIEQEELRLKRDKQRIDDYNAKTSRINATNPDGGGEVDEGTAWKNYVEEGVPEVGYGDKVDENMISALTSKFGGLGLRFTQEKGKNRESVVITDLDGKYPEDDAFTVVIKDGTNPVNKNAREEIINFIVQNKANKAKGLIATDVIKKKSNQTSGGSATFKGLDANGLPILE